MKRPDAAVPVPGYLERLYWWAYVRPGAVRLFERQWLINAVLGGNFRRLSEAALLRALEPFASDLWRREIAAWLPPGVSIEKRRFFGGLYQLLCAHRA